MPGLAIVAFERGHQCHKKRGALKSCNKFAGNFIMFIAVLCISSEFYLVSEEISFGNYTSAVYYWLNCLPLWIFWPPAAIALQWCPHLLNTWMLSMLCTWPPHDVTKSSQLPIEGGGCSSKFFHFRKKVSFLIAALTSSMIPCDKSCHITTVFIPVMTL